MESVQDRIKSNIYSHSSLNSSLYAPIAREKQTCCTDPAITDLNGYFVCQNCGVVYDRILDSAPRRAFTSEEVSKRKTSEPNYNIIGPRTLIKGKTDSKGALMSASFQTKFNRLAKIQRSLITGYERNLWIALPNLYTLRERLNIPENIYEDILRIYSKAVKAKLSMGRSIPVLLAAAVYIGFKINKKPQLIDEILAIMDVPRASVEKTYRILIAKVLPDMNVKIEQFTPFMYLDKFADQLHYSPPLVTSAKSFLLKARDRGLNLCGKDPKGFAAAALYLAVKMVKQKTTQNEIAKVSHTTDTTLRVRLRDLMRANNIFSL